MEKQLINFFPLVLKVPAISNFLQVRLSSRMIIVGKNREVRETICPVEEQPVQFSVTHLSSSEELDECT